MNWKFKYFTDPVRHLWLRTLSTKYEYGHPAPCTRLSIQFELTLVVLWPAYTLVTWSYGNPATLYDVLGACQKCSRPIGLLYLIHILARFFPFLGGIDLKSANP